MTDVITCAFQNQKTNTYQTVGLAKQKSIKITNIFDDKS